MKASVGKLGSVLITVSFLFFALALAGLGAGRTSAPGGAAPE